MVGVSPLSPHPRSTSHAELLSLCLSPAHLLTSVPLQVLSSLLASCLSPSDLSRNAASSGKPFLISLLGLILLALSLPPS